MPTSEPSASPSGCSCVASTKRSPSRISLEHLLARRRRRRPRAAHAGRSRRSAARRASRGRSCRRRRTRASACASGAARARSRPCRKPCARCAGPSSVASRCSLPRVAEHAHVHARMAQIGAGPDIGHGHESHSRVLEVFAIASPRTSLNGLVHAAHPRRQLILAPPRRRKEANVRCNAHALGKAAVERSARHGRTLPLSSAQRSARSAAASSGALPHVLMLDLGHGDARAGRAAAP